VFSQKAKCFTKGSEGSGIRLKKKDSVPDLTLKVVTNEKQGGSGRWQMIGIGLAPW
jgi:hypothetical protein